MRSPSSSPSQRMRIETHTPAPSPSQRGGMVVVGAWPCGLGIGKSLVLFTSVLIVSAICLVKGPLGPSFATTPALRPGTDRPRVDPQLYTNFTSQLILQGGHEDWVAFDRSSAPHYFTPAELSTLPVPQDMPDASPPICTPGDGMPQHCCLGSFSMAGIMVWDATACAKANFLKFQVPHKGTVLGSYRDMGDVLRRLGNRTLTFLGDSVASQHAHAMECSWLRSGKATTLSYEKKDYDRIFSHNGTGFSRAGTYGTNALYTWHTQTTDTAATQATMRFYLTYRPWLNETKLQLAESDILVVNFGLHYLIDKRDEFQEEMTAMLKLMKPFAATKGKRLVWRETSAQHHFNEGGEFPLTIAPERFGVPRRDYEATMAQCFEIHFGPYVHPQWRDKLFLILAREMGYEVKFLGSYDHLVDDDEEEKEDEQVVVEEGGKKEKKERPRRRRGVDLSAPCEKSKKKKSTAVGPDGSILEDDGEEGAIEESARKPVLYWMPFYRITSERRDLHPYNEWKKKYDCTHYCYTPFLWDPLVDGLAATMDAAAQQEEEEEEEEEDAAAEACADATKGGGEE